MNEPKYVKMTDFNPYLSKDEFIKLWDSVTEVQINMMLDIDPNPLEIFSIQIIKDTIQAHPHVLDWIDTYFDNDCGEIDNH